MTCYPGFDVGSLYYDTSSAVHSHSSHQFSPDVFITPFPAALTTSTLNRRRLRWFGISPCRPNPEGPLPSFAQLRSKIRSWTSSSCFHGTRKLLQLGSYCRLILHSARLCYGDRSRPVFDGGALIFIPIIRHFLYPFVKTDASKYTSAHALAHVAFQ